MSYIKSELNQLLSETTKTQSITFTAVAGRVNDKTV